MTVPACSVFRKTAVDQHVAISRDLTLKGLESEYLNQADHAEKFFTDAVHSDSKNVEARLKLADLYRKRDATNAAIEQLEACRKYAPKDVAVMVKLGECYADVQKNTSAMQLADEALRAERDSIGAWKLKARLNWQAKRYIDAITDLQRGLRLDPRDQEIRRNMAELYTIVGKPLRALTTLDMVAEEYDDSTVPDQLLIDQALALKKMNRNDEAISRLKIGFERNGFSEDLAEMYVASLMDEGDVGGALQAIQLAGRQFPDSPRLGQLWARIQPGGGSRIAQSGRFLK